MFITVAFKNLVKALIQYYVFCPYQRLTNSPHYAISFTEKP